MNLASELHDLLFEPEVTSPLKTLDLPLGGSKSPVDALALLIDFLTVSDAGNSVEKLADAAIGADETGEKTIEALRSGLKITRRITGNKAASLGLHPAVYFSNDKGRHSRFLFLGMCALIAEKLRDNDGRWFREFTLARKKTEEFLIANKSVIGIVCKILAGRRAFRACGECFGSDRSGNRRCKP